jgi:hypothetical protein
VGEVVWAWNDLHDSFALTFSWAFDSGRRTWVGQTVWTALNNDGAQRAILAALLDFVGQPLVTKGLRWAIKETGKLAPYRNDVVHGTMGWLSTKEGLVPTFNYGGGNSVARLLRYVDRETEDGEIVEGPNLHKLMSLLRGDLMQLSVYVRELGRILAGGRDLRPLPRRPRLLAEEFAIAWRKRLPTSKPPSRKKKTRRAS